MKLKIAVIVLAFTSGALAATDTNVVIVKAPSPETIVEGTSAQFRMGKEYQVTAQLTGFAVTPVASAGVNLGMFIDRNSLVQFEYASGESTFLWTKTEAVLAGATYKRFYGNSFYTNFALDYRRITEHADGDLFDFGSTTNDHRFIGRSETITAGIAIGNQWQWENFTLGCDWFGLNAPIAKLSSDYDRTGLTDEENSRAKEAWDRMNNQVTAQLLRFYLGASF
jgi:hypothetical protein